MKRISFIPALAVALLAACSDPGAVTSEQSLTDAQFAKNDPPPNAQAVFDLARPEDLKAEAVGSDVQLTWNPTIEGAWEDCHLKAAASDQHADTECNEVHFEVFRNGAKLADVKTTNSYVDAGLEPGAYTYWIKVKGMEGQGKAKPLTHHSRESDPATVTVGEEPEDTYEVTMVTTAPPKYALVADTVVLQKTGAFVLFFTLTHNGDSVNCTIDPSKVSVTAIYTEPVADPLKTTTAVAEKCEYQGLTNTYRYSVTLSNLANNQVSKGFFTFNIDGVNATPTPSYRFITQ